MAGWELDGSPAVSRERRLEAGSSGRVGRAAPHAPHTPHHQLSLLFAREFDSTWVFGFHSFGVFKH